MPMEESSKARLRTGLKTKMSPLRPRPRSVGVDQSS